ncbi:SDR family oxidoreductase [Dactylosporangium fulvum]|uniref:NAD(P)H-binding protein n=1 Tax=Dactylosporangium fulvum TaxID=53359 RepID=A0ABY5VW17_9ACTN|nr:NAD(P)H-binding protein [Dactylosporangium fulvum]UWP81365.1 NAD(P)H-binding protein [Dactylosporangium fulvum]
MSETRPILVTGAGGAVGAIGRRVVETLRARGLPVRAFVHHEDERAQALRATGADVVVGDLTRGDDVLRAMTGCGRVYFGMSPSSGYLEATTVAAVAARQVGDLEAFVNMSQMTVSQMTLISTVESRQHRLQWLGERVLGWSGLPVVEIRPTVFMENPMLTASIVDSIARDGTIRLPFGSARTSPVLAADVAAVVAEVLADPAPHLLQAYELTGPGAVTGVELALQFAEALGRPVAYVDMPYRQWVDEVLAPLGLPEHLAEHLATMARLHALGRYDRYTRDVERILGRPAQGVGEYVAQLPRETLDRLSPVATGRRHTGR